MDPPSLYEGETLDLVIEWQGRAIGEPQLDPLKPDFEVLGTSVGREIAFINGRRTDLRRWQIRLRPRSIGSLSIPPIAVGDEQTPRIAVEVRPLPEGAMGGPGDEIFVELLVGNEGAADSTIDQSGQGQGKLRAMVQQQLPVIVRLYSARPIRGGTLSDPAAEDAVLQRIAGDREFDTERNGRTYRVIERRYSLSPERSGSLRIGPVVFDGELAKEPSGGGASGNVQDLFERDPMMAQLFGHGPWSTFEPGERVRAQSPALTLEVDSLPALVGEGPWLPAEALELTDDWEGQPPLARVGEPLTRTITIVAQGLDANQLPEMAFSLPDSVRAYPEPPENETRSDGEHLFGISKQRINLIPTRSGRLELPAIELAWWDLEAGRQRLARLPGVVLEVEAAPLGDADVAQRAGDARIDPERPGMPGIQPGSEAVQEAEPGAGQDAASSAASDVTSVELPLWLQVLVAVLLLTALIWGGFRYWLSGHLANPLVGRSGSSASALRTVRESLVLACQADDPRAAAQALIDWARLQWPDQPPGNLSALAARLGESALASEIRRLQHCLFAPGSAKWTGAELLAILNQLDLRPARQSRSEGTKWSGLPPLYPQQH